MAVDQKATSASWGGGMAPMAPLDPPLFIYTTRDLAWRTNAQRLRMPCFQKNNNDKPGLLNYK